MTIVNYLSNSKNLKNGVIVGVKGIVVKRLIDNAVFTQELKIASQRKHRPLMKITRTVGNYLVYLTFH